MCVPERNPLHVLQLLFTREDPDPLYSLHLHCIVIFTCCNARIIRGPPAGPARHTRRGVVALIGYSVI